MKKARRFLAASLVLSLLIGLLPTAGLAATDSYSADYQTECYDYSWADASGDLKLVHYYENVLLYGDSPQVQKINAMQNEGRDAFCEAAQEFVLGVIENPPRFEGDCYQNYYTAEVTKNEDGIFSVKLVQHWYMGGVYNSVITGQNYNLRTGEQLRLAELFSLSKSALEGYLKNQSLQFISTHSDMIWWDDARDIINAYTLDDYNFYVDGNKVVLVYDQYELGPGAIGVIQVSCPIINNSIKVTLNSEALSFDQPPIMDNNRVMVPIRAIFEALGYNVVWDQTTQTGVAYNGQNTIQVQVNNPTITYDGGTYTCDVAPKNISGRILVPVRAISESAGCDVYWNQSTRTVEITAE